MRFLAPLVTVLLITAVSWLLVALHVAPVVPGRWTTVVAFWALSVLPVFVLVRNFTTKRYPSAATRLWMFRPFWYTQLLMLALALLATIAFVVALPFGAGMAAGRWTTITGAAALVVVGIWGYVGSRRLVTRTIELAHPRLPARLDGLRIVQLSDLHVGPHTSRTQLERIAEATRRAAAHIIAYTGDQVDDHPADVDAFASAFGNLTAPLGVYAIPGNHDIYAGWPEVRHRLEAIGIGVLVNESVRIAHDGEVFYLAGTGDPAAGQKRTEAGGPDVERTMQGVPTEAFCLVLAHNPALFPALSARGADVVLSGHTHHGQFSIPSRNWSLATVFLDYAMGTYSRDGALLYISPGTNFWGIPFRIGALPEVTVITLRRPE
ncbi:MAG: metallophosphoesterase [Gemmatimonadaceae bacterium]